jgi:hypothetical protein
MLQAFAEKELSSNMLLSYWPRLFCLLLFSMGVTQIALGLLLRSAMPFVDGSIGQMTARCQERIRFAIPATPHIVSLLVALLVMAPQYFRNETNPLQEHVGIACVIGASAVAVRYFHGVLRAALLLLKEQQTYNLNGVPVVLTGGVQAHISEATHPLLAVTGILSPRILISRHLLNHLTFSQEQLEIALAHEGAHVSHHDNLKHLMLSSFCSGKDVFLRRWRQAAEIAADDDAAAGNSSRAILLAETLLIAARIIPDRRTSILALDLRPHEEELDRRIDRLLCDHSAYAPATAPRWRQIMGATALVLVGICTLLQFFAEPLHEISEYVLHLG